MPTGDHQKQPNSLAHPPGSVQSAYYLHTKPGLSLIWTALMPYRLDVTANLVNGKNTLELDVTNL
jgi:hypothetical protein